MSNGRNCVNLVITGVHEMGKHTLKIYVICCKIFNVCLTIYWIPGIIGLRPICSQDHH